MVKAGFVLTTAQRRIYGEEITDPCLFSYNEKTGSYFSKSGMSSVEMLDA